MITTNGRDVIMQVNLSPNNVDKALEHLRNFEQAVKNGTVVPTTYVGVLATMLSDLSKEN